VANVSITDFGAVGDGRTDNQAAIQRAFDYAAANKVGVYIPNGVFLHSGALTANGITISGAGEGAVLKATTYGTEAIVLQGDGVALSDVHLIGVGAGRHQNITSCPVLVQGATHFSVENVHLENTSGAGIFVQNSSYGHIADNLVQNTKADSIHMTAGSHDIVVERNRIEHSGDDGIAVVSYGGQTPTNHITIRDNDVLYNDWGRGISTVGGTDVVIEHNNIVGGTADRAGIYISAESEWNTQAVHNIRVTGNTLTDAGGARSHHGAITLYNSRPGLINDGIVVANNNIINPRRDGILVTGSGEQRITQYDNRLSAQSDRQLLTNVAPNAYISTRPSTVGTRAVE